MDTRCSLMLAFVLLNSNFATATEANISTRVVGGIESSEGDWPWMVAVRPGGYQCGGTLIDERTVLTAAHCLYDGESEIPAKQISVLVGAYDLSSPPPSIAITSTYIHSSYNPENSASSNDIALLRLRRNVTDIVNIERVDSETTTTAVALESDVTTLGWGSTVAYNPEQQVTPSYPYILQQVQLPLQRDADCSANAGDRYNSATMVCAAEQAGGKDACQGDSGGPLLLNTGTSWQQIGIVSWGAGCASIGNPGVYTRVAAYKEWIENFLTGIAIHNKLTYQIKVIGESEQLDLMISNNSASQALLSFSLSDTNAFSFDETRCEIVAANSICKLPITYTATTDEANTASLTIESDITDANSVTTILSAPSPSLPSSVSSSSGGGGGGSILFIFTLPLLLLRRYFAK